ncbi:MAG: DUF58 domain-containing protein [Idiomarina sp.]|nr:DUF58 domain-containing protein [Idiomarina sp.]
MKLADRRQSLTTTDWLTRWSSNGYFPDSRELLYYRRLPITPPYVRSRGTGLQQGTRLSAWRGRGMEFDEVRHYQAGDDIRAIDWRVTARTGKTHTKLFREERERPIFVCVDFSDTMLFGSQLLFKAVQASHLAAAIAWGALKRGDRIGGVFFSSQDVTEAKPAARQRGVMHFIEQLLRAYPAESSSAPASQTLNQQLQRLLQLAHPGSDIVIVSDFAQLNEDSIALLKGLQRHSAVTAIRITDPLEQQLPDEPADNLRVRDGEHSLSLNLGSSVFRQDFSTRAEQIKAAQAQCFRQAGTAVIDISAGLPLELQWGRRR